MVQDIVVGIHVKRLWGKRIRFGKRSRGWGSG